MAEPTLDYLVQCDVNNAHAVFGHLDTRLDKLITGFGVFVGRIFFHVFIGFSFACPCLIEVVFDEVFRSVISFKSTKYDRLVRDDVVNFKAANVDGIVCCFAVGRKGNDVVYFFALLIPAQAIKVVGFSDFFHFVNVDFDCFFRLLVVDFVAFHKNVLSPFRPFNYKLLSSLLEYVNAQVERMLEHERNMSKCGTRGG